MKTITHKLWPVSYINDEGKQVNTIYTWNPSNADPTYWVGEPITIDIDHPAEMDDKHRIAKILKLREELAKLEAGQ